MIAVEAGRQTHQVALSLRAERWPEDETFLRELSAAVHTAALGADRWPPALLEPLLRQQFEAQRTSYRQSFPDAAFDVILWHGQPVGQLCVHRQTGIIHLVNIALHPTAQGRGIGSDLLKALCAEAAGEGCLVWLEVALLNPARRLYERHGFLPVADDGVNLAMEWRPPQLKTA